MDDKLAADDELRQLMSRYQDGETEALELLVRQLSPGLIRYLCAWGLDMSDAEDLLQECWIQIHRSRRTYRPSEPLKPWIFAIARHVRLDGYRKKRRLESRETLIGEFSEHLPSNTPAASAADLKTLLASLPDKQREVVLMLKGLGMSLEEVARATSSTVGAVKQRAHRAYKTLRRSLEEAKHER